MITALSFRNGSALPDMQAIWIPALALRARPE